MSFTLNLHMYEQGVEMIIKMVTFNGTCAKNNLSLNW